MAESLQNGTFADTQSNGASGAAGVEIDIHRTIKNCSSSGSAQAPETHSSQLVAGCPAMVDGGVGSTLPDPNIADYMGDSFGELCLDALSCDNATAALTGAGINQQNVTQLLLDATTNGGNGILGSGDDDSLFNYCMNRAGNISYLNISCEFELEYATPLYGFCIPILLFVTVTVNLLIVIVLSRRSMATPTNSVLMGECIAITLLVLG